MQLSLPLGATPAAQILGVRERISVLDLIEVLVQVKALYLCHRVAFGDLQALVPVAPA